MRARVVRRLVVVGSILALLLPGSAPVGAAPAGSERRPPAPPLADADRDGLSDGLEAALADAGPGERFRVVATFDGPGGARQAQEAVGPFRVLREFRIVPGFAAVMTKAQIVALAARAEIFRIEQDFRVRATMDAADADFGTEAARAAFATTGDGVEVCVVDTGVSPGHEQLDGKAPIPFFDAVNGRTTAYDDNGHGTHVASIAVGDGVGGPDAARYGGVAPDAELAAAKVLNSSGSGSDSQVIAGVQWCAERPSTRVISMSLGTAQASDGRDSLSQAVNNAAAAGKVVVVAAGNSGDDLTTVGSPGAAAGALTVGAAAEYSAPVGAPNHSDGVYLAFFSSRGPTVDGRTKPDVTAPGVSITAAQAGTTAGYATYSGTSMATPFVSGTVALMLALRPAWGPAEVRSAVEGTARDRGPAGKDVDWGAGVLDGYAAVAAAAGSSGASAFPAHVRVTGSVPDGGTWSYPFSLTDLSTPIAATLIIDGARVCVFPWVFGCLAYEWSPDLDAELRDPTGAVIAASTCAAGSECGIGRQETLHAMPTVAGTYTIVVYPYAGDPNAGKGGSFSIDLSTGPVGTGTPPPPPPPTPTMHVGDLDGAGAKVKSGWRATVTVVVHDEGHSALSGVTVSGIWSYGTAASCVTSGDGACSLTSKKLSNRTASVSFSVSGLSKDGYADAASANHDVDAGTDGTTVTVTKPA
ncbi:MAG TPA: S8 family serine peptidase [Actinomycetota bacterium]|nr:S8 family serine peptidase [Actinomycetota bacterium]